MTIYVVVSDDFSDRDSFIAAFESRDEAERFSEDWHFPSRVDMCPLYKTFAEAGGANDLH